MTKAPGDMADDEIAEAVEECAHQILNQRDASHWCVYVERMRALLGELKGKPTDHGDHVSWFRTCGRKLP